MLCMQYGFDWFKAFDKEDVKIVIFTLVNCYKFLPVYDCLSFPTYRTKEDKNDLAVEVKVKLPLSYNCQ